MNKLCLLICPSLMLAGCVTVPPPAGQAYSASYVGDSGSIQVSEVVVSVPDGNKPGQYRNLHVAFSALINAKMISSADQNNVEGIIRRSRTRISSEIVKEITSQGEIRINDLGSLRGLLEQKAQSSFDSVYSKWTRSAAFEVKIVVTSIYFTDGSVGTTSATRAFMW